MERFGCRSPRAIANWRVHSGSGRLFLPGWRFTIYSYVQYYLKPRGNVCTLKAYLTRFDPNPYTVLANLLGCAVQRRTPVFTQNLSCQETSAEKWCTKCTGGTHPTPKCSAGSKCFGTQSSKYSPNAVEPRAPSATELRAPIVPESENPLRRSKRDLGPLSLLGDVFEN